MQADLPLYNAEITAFGFIIIIKKNRYTEFIAKKNQLHFLKAKAL